MSNITPILSSILREVQSADPIPEHVPTSQTLDTFLQEAYRINSHISSLLGYLRRIRQPYLSTAPPPRRALTTTPSSNTTTIHLTDPERAQIDSDTTLLLRDLSANIESLTAAESLRASTETALLQKKYGQHTGLLWRWAAGDEDDAESRSKSPKQEEDEGKAMTLKTVRETVLWYLGRELARAVELKREMVEIRCDREREREKSVLWKKAGGAGGSAAQSQGQSGAYPSPNENIHDTSSLNNSTTINGSASSQQPQYQNSSLPPELLQDNTSPQPSSIESVLTPTQLSLFASENASLLQHYNDTLSQVKVAEKSLIEISELQSTMITHLSTQGEMIDQLVQDAQGTDENLRRGNRELKRAAERTSTARGVFWVTVGICGFLVGWDLVF